MYSSISVLQCIFDNESVLLLKVLMPWIQLTGSKKVELCDLQTEMKKLSPAVHLREVIRIEDTAVLGSMVVVV